MQLASISPWRDRGRGRDETGGAPVEARQAISLVWLPPSTGENNEAIPAASPMSQRSVVQIDPRHPRNHGRRSKRLCFPGTPNVVGEESCPDPALFRPPNCSVLNLSSPGGRCDEGRL